MPSVRAQTKAFNSLNRVQSEEPPTTRLPPEYAPMKFLEHVIQNDPCTGENIPVWKRYLVAKQIAERAFLEDEMHRLVSSMGTLLIY